MIQNYLDGLGQPNPAVHPLWAMYMEILMEGAEENGAPGSVTNLRPTINVRYKDDSLSQALMQVDLSVNPLIELVSKLNLIDEHGAKNQLTEEPLSLELVVHLFVDFSDTPSGNAAIEFTRFYESLITHREALDKTTEAEAAELDRLLEDMREKEGSPAGALIRTVKRNKN